MDLIRNRRISHGHPRGRLGLIFAAPPLTSLLRPPSANGLRLLRMAGVIALAALGACQELNVTAVRVGQVEITPKTASVLVGQTRQLSATVKDADGHELKGRAVDWSSESATIAEVDANGMVRALAPGTAVIRAAVEGRAGEATITVTRPAVASVLVSPSAVTLERGETAQFQAEAKAGDGSVIPGLTAAWTSGNTAVASVDANGVATAITFGETTISATIEGVMGEASLTVLVDPIDSIEIIPSAFTVAVSDTVRLRAVARARDGVELPGRQILWSTSNPQLATVSTDGLVTGLSEGSATITASAEGRTADATAEVIPAPVASVEVAPSQSTLQVGATVRLQAIARAPNGSPLTGRTANWSSDKPAVAAVDNDGLVTAHGVGEANITATVDGVTGAGIVTVVFQPVAMLTLMGPSSDTLYVGDSATLTAVAKAADGTELNNRVIVWSSDDPSILRVDASGATATLVALAPGSVRVTAISEGVSATAAFTVLQKPIASVDVTPPSPSIVVDGTVQLQAVLEAQDGSILTNRTVAWTSDKPAVATVNGNGLVRGVSVGTAVIVATSEGRSGQATVTVTDKPVASVVVQPQADTLEEGETVRFTAVLTASDGSTLSGRQVSWSTNNPGVAGVDQQGNVTAVSVGQAVITATAEGQSGNSSVIVVQKAIARLEIQPTSAAVLPGGSQVFTAVVKAADGTVLRNRRVTWRSLDSRAASVQENSPLGQTATATAIAVVCVNTNQSCPVGIEAVAGPAADTVTLDILKPVASIDINPSTLTLRVDSSKDLTATVKAADGTALVGRSLTWSSSDPTIATVQSAGSASYSAAVKAVGAPCTGTACTVTIMARAEGVTGTSTVTVPKPVASVAISPSTVTLDEGASATAVASVKAADGTVLPNRPVTWTSSAPNIATANPSGANQLSAAIRAGQCPQGAESCTGAITATAEGVSGTLDVTVQKTVDKIEVQPSTLNVPKGRTGTVQARVTAADGTVLTKRAVTWQTADPNIATVTGAGALGQEATVTGVELGTTQITATSFQRQANATIAVVPPIATIEILPSNQTLAEGENVQLTTLVKSATGALLSDRRLTWSSTNSAVANATGTGTFLQQAVLVAGTCPVGASTCNATIQATAEGVAGSAAVTVIKPVATVTITPNPTPDLRPGDSLQLNALVRAADGTDLTAHRPVTWSSSNDAIATVTRNGGLVTATDSPCPAGTTSCAVTITATVAGTSSSVLLRVLSALRP